jgi:hypothetical protein
LVEIYCEIEILHLKIFNFGEESNCLRVKLEKELNEIIISFSIFWGLINTLVLKYWVKEFENLEELKIKDISLKFWKIIIFIKIKKRFKKNFKPILCSVGNL